eukprot:TRINITY_DN7811_c0_g1_i3.p2 TRINITY_DN7811_c0_g1~~TRINITY_DN7811_c0_g1_i3.p2  ORF type:complete len:160 (+),score=27.20 TRINITY_DN7811_c0_g1_i3:26-505(+)
MGTSKEEDQTGDSTPANRIPVEFSKETSNEHVSDKSAPFDFKQLQYNAPLVPSSKEGSHRKDPVPPIKKLNDIKVHEGEYMKGEPGSDEVPYELGELDGEPMVVHLMTDKPEETKERESIDKYEAIPFFARTPKDVAPCSFKRPLSYRYNWFPVSFKLR